MQNFLLRAIRAYQAFSRMLWQYRPPLLVYSSCRFYPTCSEYSYNAILKYGALQGSIKGIWRILRCNPFSQGGHDEA